MNRAARPLPSVERILRDFTYDPNTGEFRNARYKGVQFNRKLGKWEARFGSGPTFRWCGLYNDPKIAHQAYVAAAEDYFGEFANPGTAA